MADFSGAARRIRCDRARPSCVRCTRTGRVCDGLYVLRLSWPRNGDSRRAMVGPAPTSWQDTQAAGELQWVCTSFRDIEVYHYLLQSAPTSTSNAATFTDSLVFNARGREAPQPVLSIPISWMPVKLDTKEMDLFQYCKSTESERCGTSKLKIR